LAAVEGLLDRLRFFPQSGLGADAKRAEYEPSAQSSVTTPCSGYWLVTALLARRPTKVAAIALANKLARMAWAMIARGERYKEPIALAA